MMAGGKLAQMIEADAVGEELIRRGWCQGSLLPAVSAQKSWLVVKTIVGKLRATDDRHRILDGISELLFMTYNETMPYQIDMLFIRDERNNAPEVSGEDSAKLASWIADILKQGGNAELVHWEILSTKDISVYDYSNANELPTDQYSLDEDDNTSD